MIDFIRARAPTLSLVSSSSLDQLGILNALKINALKGFSVFADIESSAVERNAGKTGVP